MAEIFQHFMKPNCKGGFAVLATHCPGDSYIKVVTSHCSRDDQYSKKIACSMLREQYFSQGGIRIPLPSSVSRKNATHRDIRDVVLDVFSVVQYF